MTDILPSIKADIERDGYAIYPAFFENELICQVQIGVAHVINAIAHRYGVWTGEHEHSLHSGILALARAHRPYVAEIYDAIRQIPALHRMVTQTEGLFREVRGYYAKPGIAEGGACIRIDLPHEEAFRSNWHQEYPYQGRSQNGLAFWAPILPITPDMGPVEILAGSHKLGVLPLTDARPEGYKASYGRVIEGEAALIAEHETQAPCLSTGDLMVMDYLTVHRSGENTSAQPRWAALWRYFDFAAPDGVAGGWKKVLPG